MNKIEKIYTKYKHGIPLLVYMAVYLGWFAWLEKTNTKNFHVIHVNLDDYIPFWEIFVIPYLLWFVYVAATVAYLFLTDKQEYFKSFAFLATGMTLFLIISTLWPNGHHLRPAEMPPRDNIFIQLVSLLWKTDTPTNLWPSIHVYNSLGAHFAIAHCPRLRAKKGIRIASGMLATSIILSTMLIKQHSVFDVMTGLGLGYAMYLLIYKREAILSARAQRKKGEGTPQAG